MVSIIAAVGVSGSIQRDQLSDGFLASACSSGCSGTGWRV
uniref:Uncharacterized protein n=1 Tax=Anguilla anguilla TaxID=7936 RepID=A0A0E9R1C4_ANGAN